MFYLRGHCCTTAGTEVTISLMLGQCPSSVPIPAAHTAQASPTTLLKCSLFISDANP